VTGDLDRECPECGREAATVVHVQSVGFGEMDPVIGTVHPIHNGVYGEGWLLYCHSAERDST